uniref:Peptidase M12B domain-containing protein n=1 Tax=Clastoptera arizonana TaxID=38151 RepID=A0A1B6E598_9HEMI
MAAMSLLHIVGCYILIITGTSARSNTIHRHMTPQDLRTVFHVDSHAEVPEYEVVRVRRTATERDRHNVRLKAFGRDLQLSLKRAQGLYKDDLRVWTAEPNVTGEVLYTPLPQEDVGHAYQDVEKLAAILLHKDDEDGTLLMQGTIGHDLVLKPVPAHIRQHLDSEEEEDDDDEMFLDEEAADDQVVSGGFPLAPQHKHIVYRRDIQDPDQFSDYALMEPDSLPQKFRSKRSLSRTTREAPYVIYPEILVIVDYDGYRLHGGDNVQIKRYFVSFWNGVDLRYKLLKGPKIRISIAGIIISRGRDATPYLERNRVGRDAIDSAAALTDMGKYLFRERRLPVYDIAVAVTKYDMCRRRKGGRCTKGTAGFAYVGGACVVNKRLEKVNSVAIIEDTGGFSGIIVAAHEVGHLLGAVHDGSPPPTYLGGPGAEKCRWEDGYIMSDLRHTEKGFKWSSCSIASFHHFLNGDTATCLYNSPHEDESLPRVLPGKLLTLDAQCRKDRGTSACFKDERVCAQLFCFDASSGYCVAYRPAAEGSICGDGQVCNNGRCVAEHENIIPDYSQNTPTYLRRSDGDTVATQTRPFYSQPLNYTTQRSEWDEFWRTANATESTYYSSSSTTTKPYYHYYTTPTSTTEKTTTTKNPYNFNNYYNKNQFSTTTKNPYDDYNKNYYSTTKNPFDFKSKTTTKSTYNYKFTTSKPTKNVNTNYYNKATTTTRSPYQNNNNNIYATTKNPYQPYTTAKTYTTQKTEDSECVDKATKLSGGMSCYELLTRYGYQYCGLPFFIQNCCAAQKYICDKRFGRRR